MVMLEVLNHLIHVSSFLAMKRYCRRQLRMYEMSAGERCQGPVAVRLHDSLRRELSFRKR